MRRVILLVVLAVALGAHPALAQDTARQARSSHVRGIVDRAEGATEVMHKSLAIVDTLRNFDPTEEQVIFFVEDATPLDSGFVYGTNYFGDQSKASALTLPAGITEAVVTEVNVWFAYRRDGLTTERYAIEILDGTTETGPGNLIKREEFLLADVNATSNPDQTTDETNHVLTEPVQVGSTFFVSVDFGSYAPVDWGTAAIVSSPLRGNRVPEVWEKWANGTWNNASDSWDFGAGFSMDGCFLWIEAVVDTDLGTAAEDADELPHAFTLVQNFPNPFSASTTLQIELPTRAEVHLYVVDLLGRTVATLAEGSMAAGIHTVRFDADDLPPGVYLARLRAGTATMTHKMILTH